MLFVDVTETHDLIHWSEPRRLTQDELNFSSPGNVLRVGDTWVLCVQSYPLDTTEPIAGDNARLWLMESRDLVHWTDPSPIAPQGCQAAWARSRRQIDPYLIAHDNKYWCFYKTDGQLGLLVSTDLKTWTEASPDAPVLAAAQTPDGATVENPCVVRDGDEFVLFFSPCRDGRGVGAARSSDLIHWRDVRYLDIPTPDWAPAGITAAMVLDARPSTGRWIMSFHGEQNKPHSGQLGLACSDDLKTWRLA